MITDELRSDFLEFFAKRGHRIVKSSSLVPHDDPTILFTNAGMNQFKHVFTGEERKDYKTAVSCQKCMRAGGKHNDLENVGYTARHHTFFEMLGNFSFGDYFKKEAIEYAWEFVTKNLGLSESRLWVSVYKGDKTAYELWKDHIGIPAKKILRLGEKDNFWVMGETGPCGPCSEIHYDNGPGVGCGRKTCSPECDCDRFVEIWNLVFMEFNRDESSKETPLPRPCIDTGMGLERVSAIKHGVISNYDIDVFKPLILHLCELSSKHHEKTDEETKVSMRAIADHVRAGTFLIAEGIVPSNEGRGYVLRRVVRRAMRHGHLLGIGGAFLYRLVDDVVNKMGGFYTELTDEAKSIKEIMKNEEESFLKTSSRGLEILGSQVKKILASGKKKALFPGGKAFDLYATYGFPLDLTEDALKKHNLKVDVKAFNEAFLAHKKLARGTFKHGVGSEAPLGEFESLKPTRFVGYETLKTEREKLIKKSLGLKPGEVSLVFSKTPFYAESGGQIGDEGYIYNDRVRVSVKKVLKNPAGVCIHFGIVTRGKSDLIKENEAFILEVDKEKRLPTARHHTATHLLHKALRKHLGTHVKQSGSLVEPERLRFDFSHTGAIPKDVLRKVEDEVNDKILANLEVVKEFMPVDKAKSLGAMALFGEKYGDEVRVIRIKEGGKDYSIELCGGTHVDRTGDIGLMKVIGEGSVASGIRRIEAVCGGCAVREFRKIEDRLSEVASILKTTPDEAAARAAKNVRKIKELEKQMSSGGGDKESKSSELLGQAKARENFKVLSAEASIDNPKSLRELADTMMDRIGNGIVVLGAKSDGKAFLVAKVSKGLTSKYRAKDLIKAISKIIGGGGGGKDEIAEAGGAKPENLKKALEKVYEIVK